MTLRQFVYRYIYLKTAGWKITRWLWLDVDCDKCGGTRILQLHHVRYPFFEIWYALLPVVLVVWYFWDGGLWLLVLMLIIPDTISPFMTLCKRCHELEERRKR